jgi:hypothetical protein
VAERFTAGSVTGWLINQASPKRAGDSRHTPTTIWYVHDSADCFHTVREFRNSNNGKAGGRVDAETEARKLAARLNRDYP